VLTGFFRDAPMRAAPVRQVGRGRWVRLMGEQSTSARKKAEEDEHDRDNSRDLAGTTSTGDEDQAGRRFGRVE